MKTLLPLLAAFVASMLLPTPTQAANVPVTVTINSVRNVSAGDSWGGAPDFYARIWIDGNVLRTPTVHNSHGFVSPAGWTLTRTVSRTQRGGVVPVRIELRDFDAPLSDPLVDIDPAGCPFNAPFGCSELSVGTPPVDSFGIDVSLNLFDGSWAPRDPSGDSSIGPAGGTNPQMACTIGAGSNVANICFTISVGAATPEILTVRKTSDSDRGFCPLTDCSLREAITLAESGDTVELLASATPYTLGPLGRVHLEIRQSLLNVRGPTNGGTAVIRQTQGAFRVFDVFGGARLVMNHVTVTGGGGGWSTAYPGHLHGGGIHNHGTIDLTHVTITGNRATDPSDIGGGGGIFNAGTGNARLTNVTIAGNSAATNVNGIPLGGGIAGPGTFTLRNTVIANNTVEGSGAASNCGVSRIEYGGLARPMNIVDEGGNLQFPGGDCGRWVSIKPQKGEVFNTPVRSFWWPYFTVTAIDPLQPFDAARGIYFPLPAGPAVDVGVAGCGPTDQTGRSVPRDGNGDGVAACDAGAVEAQ